MTSSAVSSSAAAAAAQLPMADAAAPPPPPPPKIGMEFDGLDEANLTGDGVFVDSSETKIMIDFINYVAYGIVANVIVGVGIVGNILNLIVLSRPKLKGVMYVYLLGLAVSNLCVLIMAIPALMDLTGNIDINVPQSTAFYLAHLEIPLLNSFMASSVYIIICMTVNRYISIYKPTHFQRIHTFKNAYIGLLFSFLGGLILHIPLAFERRVIAAEGNGSLYTTKTNQVIADHPMFRVYLWISEALLRLGPIITLTILNIMIIVRFHSIAKKREVLKSGAGGGQRGSLAGGCLGGMPSSSGGERSGATACGRGPIIGPPSPSRFSNGGQTSSTCHTTSTSVSIDANGRLAVPSSSVVVANSVVVVAEDRSTCHVTTAGATSSTDEGFISRAATPVSQGSCRGYRGTPQRISTKRRGLHNPEERMLVCVLVGIVVLFVVCTTPAAVLSVLYTEENKKKVWFAIFRAVANNLELLCFALNFFVYCLCSADIRRAFVDVLFENVAVRFFRRHSFKGNGIEVTTVNNAPASAAAAASVVAPPPPAISAPSAVDVVAEEPEDV